MMIGTGSGLAKLPCSAILRFGLNANREINTDSGSLFCALGKCAFNNSMAYG
jgi:hypothetical protein